VTKPVPPSHYGPHSKFSIGIADLLIRLRWWLLIVALITLPLADRIASRIELERSIESFFSHDDPLIITYQSSNSTFGTNEYLLVAYDDPVFESIDEQGFFDETVLDHLDHLNALAQKLEQVPGIKPGSASTLADLATAPSPVPYRIAQVFRRLISSKQKDLLDFGESIVISEDRRTVGIVLTVDPKDTPAAGAANGTADAESTDPRAETFRRIREIAAAHDPPAFVAGEPLQVNDLYRYIQEDSTLLGWASAGLMTLVILLLFRSLRWVILPLLVVHAALIWTKAILVVADLRLSMVSSILTSLMTIIAIATVTHITVTYREWRLSVNREMALRATIASLCSPILWTILTTAVGFAALLTSQILPVRSFGVMMTLGTLMVLVAVCTLIPGGTLLTRFDSDPRPTLLENRLVGGLHRLDTITNRKPKSLLIFILMVMGFAAWGLTRLTVETDFSKNFRQDSDIVKALTFFEDRLGGAGNWEVYFTGPDELNEETAIPIRELASRLRAIETPHGGRLTKVIAVTDGIDLMPGRDIERRIDLIRTFQPDFLSSLYHEENKRMRIVLRSLERQPAEVKLELIEAVVTETRKTYPDAPETGIYVLLATIIDSLLADQLLSFLVASAGVLLCMSIAFRSVVIGLISLVPNLFPILLVIGGLGWVGMPINIGTAMIACVSMGLSVDSSVHYLHGYLSARRTGASHEEATYHTHGRVGLALLFANLALVFGFLVLMLSNFIPLVYFGLLASLSMIGGLIGNLVLLPLLLRYVTIPADAIVEEVNPPSEMAPA